MPFELKSCEKFACIAFENIALEKSVAETLALGDGLWVLRYPPVQLDAWWKQWVGTFKSEQIERSNLFLIAVQASQTPEILDHENEKLRSRLNLFLYGLLLQGIPDHIEGWAFTGARISTDTRIRSMGNLDDFYHSQPKARVIITAGTCKTAKLFADGYGTIEASADYDRMKRGMRGVIRGMQEQHAQDRLHEYVRALEALIKPIIGATTKQFVHRCQTFAAASTEAGKILGECYAIRNAVEHMHSWDVALADYPKASRHAVGLCRLRQIEALTFVTYLKLATSAVHAAFFKTDADIDIFWQKKDHERLAAWGTNLDVTKIE